MPSLLFDDFRKDVVTRVMIWVTLTLLVVTIVAQWGGKAGWWAL